MSVLDDAVVRALLKHAWIESQPGETAAHEEGGFVLREEAGSLSVERWPRGMKNQILVPSHTGCVRGNFVIVATFHTHPNPGPDFQQEPSVTDIRAVRDDPDLDHPDYEEEYVIATDSTYRILRSGDVELVGETSSVLAPS